MAKKSSFSPEPTKRTQNDPRSVDPDAAGAALRDGGRVERPTDEGWSCATNQSESTPILHHASRITNQRNP